MNKPVVVWKHGDPSTGDRLAWEDAAAEVLDAAKAWVAGKGSASKITIAVRKVQDIEERIENRNRR